MIICMSEILCVTNRHLCREDFLTRMEAVAATGPAGVILREKDLPETEYLELARQTVEIATDIRRPVFCTASRGQPWSWV